MDIYIVIKQMMRLRRPRSGTRKEQEEADPGKPGEEPMEEDLGRAEGAGWR